MKINGIQQLGVGVTDIEEAWNWYRRFFSMDILMFDEEAVAELMLAHTDGQPRKRHAILALNLEGGGGFEIWKHTGKSPTPIDFEIQLGDLGINIGVLKCQDVEIAYQKYASAGLNLLGEISIDPNGKNHFFLKDLYNNIWEIKEHPEVFKKEKAVNGGVFGTIIGVKSIDESLTVYKDILGYDEVIYDQTGVFNDYKFIAGGDKEFRRVLLRHSDVKNGAFSSLFGKSEIELVQVLNREQKAIYEGRIWGDPGFIHLCFDINDMDALRDKAKRLGFPFTVDSAKAMDTFDMGDAGGNFAYIQAPEGTLIEFVETHKIPLIKKIGWNIDFRKRGNHPLPRWILNLFKYKRVK